MKIEKEGTNGVATGWSRNQLLTLKQLPGAYKIIGLRFKFPLSDIAVIFIREHFPNAQYIDFPESKKAGVSVRSHFEYKLSPFKHQKDEFEKSRHLEYYGAWWEMGTGKSKFLIDTGAWLYHEGEIDAMVVLTYNGVHLNWKTKEIPIHLHENTDPMVVAWDSVLFGDGRKWYAEGLQKLTQHTGFAILCFNVEALRSKKSTNWLLAFLKKKKCLVIVDESQLMKEPTAGQSKTLVNKVRPLAKYRRCATGTPVGNSPLNIFNQIYFLAGEVLGFDNYYAFRKRYAIMEELRDATGRVKTDRRGRPIQIVVGHQKIEELEGALFTCGSRFLKKDCLDLPPKLPPRVRPFLLSPEQVKIYNQLKEETVADFKGGRMTTQLAVTRLIRFQQICCNIFVSDDAQARANLEGSEIIGASIADVNPRMTALMTELEQLEGKKTIIWAHYRFSMVEIFNALTEKYGKGCAVGYSGFTPVAQRPMVIDKFQTDPSCSFFVGHPKVGGTGITITASSDVIYYSNGPSLLDRLQSEDRNHRIGQTEPVSYTDLAASGTIDEKLINDLQHHRDVADQITGDKLVEQLLTQ